MAKMLSPEHTMTRVTRGTICMTKLPGGPPNPLDPTLSSRHFLSISTVTYSSQILAPRSGFALRGLRNFGGNHSFASEKQNAFYSRKYFLRPYFYIPVILNHFGIIVRYFPDIVVSF